MSSLVQHREWERLIWPWDMTGSGGQWTAHKLPDYCTVYQAEAVALRKAQKQEGHREGRIGLRAVLSSMSGRSCLAALVAEIECGVVAGDSCL